VDTHTQGHSGWDTQTSRGHQLPLLRLAVSEGRASSCPKSSAFARLSLHISLRMNREQSCPDRQSHKSYSEYFSEIP